MTYPEALQKLQYWLTNNQTSHANHLNFDVCPLSAAELQAIHEYTQNRLPESYYYSNVARGIFSIRGTPA
ncbi:hypothetical protein ACTHSL_12730 [Neisseria sp. P0008.S010]|uniref:hypothetical protein n=1 Tax=Neisseria sp. P0008.S010 TaxID=3436707 RepID=UPI003F820EF1